MATCAACGTTILFGGSEVQGRRVCNARCAAAMNETLAKETIPEAVALERAQAIRTGTCPKCNGVGQPIEIQHAHRCISYLVATSRSSRMLLACHSCGNKLRIRESLLSLVAGWWGERWRLEEVRGLMGHSTIRVTERYAHLADSTLKQVAAATHRSWLGAVATVATPLPDQLPRPSKTG